jgi:hypothetical protein
MMGAILAGVAAVAIGLMRESADRCEECGEKMPPIVADFSYVCDDCAVGDEVLMRDVLSAAPRVHRHTGEIHTSRRPGVARPGPGSGR